MHTIDPSAWLRQVRPIVGALHANPAIRSTLHEEARPTLPFITISREAGSGALPFAQRLVQRLNQTHPGDVEWTGWDRELVEKVAADHHLSRELVESLEERDRNWLSEFLSGLSITSSTPSEETVFRDVCTTVRAIAQAGRVVLVGMGAVCITRNLPGGIHIRLVAPHDYRVHSLARSAHLTPAQAEQEVKRLDKNRQAFYARHWPGHHLAPEEFHLTLNVARLTEEQAVACIASIVPMQTRLSAPASAADVLGV
jgi:cytidylate kinase